MIVTKLQGGLGNQLFQWAYGKSLSIQLNQPLYLDLSFLNRNIPGITKREYELHYFDKILDQTIESLSEHNLSNLKYQRVTDRQNTFLYPDTNYYLDGYFQNEKYFLQFTDIIKRQLEPRESVITEVYDIARQIQDCDSISLHVRRTDYLSNPFHQTKDTNYYNSALEQIKTYDKLFVFSDDISWCKSNLQFDDIIFIENLSNIQDLYLMSLCKNNIIANSSFSWWAAWLNNNPDKNVVCPNSWFRGVEASSFVPSNWIKI